jgi:hypothetical protein
LTFGATPTLVKAPYPFRDVVVNRLSDFSNCGQFFFTRFVIENNDESVVERVDEVVLSIELQCVLVDHLETSSTAKKRVLKINFVKFSDLFSNFYTEI